MKPIFNHQVAAASALALSLSLCLMPASRKLGQLATLATGSYSAATLLVGGSIRARFQQLTAEQQHLRDQAAKALQAERAYLQAQIYQGSRQIDDLKLQVTTLEQEKQQKHACGEQLLKCNHELIAAAHQGQKMIARYEQLCPEYLSRATAAEIKADMTETAIQRLRQQQAEQSERDRQQLQAQLSAEFQAELEKRQHALEADKLERIKHFKSEHRQREQFLHAQIEELRAAIAQRDTRLQEEFSKVVQPYEELYEELDAALAQYAQEFGGARAEFGAAYRAKQEETEKLYGELRQYRNPAPFRGASKADIIGNKLIDFYLARGIILDAERCQAQLDKSLIWVRPRATTLEGIKDHLESLQLAFELVKKPEPKIESGCIHFELKDARIDLPVEITEPPSDKLLEAIAQANHVRINAPTDSGKSTLLDNILNIYRLLYRGQMGLTLLDPKYPFTPWQGHSPDYKGFSECLTGVTKLSRLIEARLTEARQCADQGEPLPSYDPHLFAIDELEILHDDALEADGNKKGDVTKSVEKAIRTGLKVGRGLTLEKGKGIKVLYVTQSPLCSRIGLNRDDFEQSLNLYTGGNIALVLQDSGELDGKILDAKRKTLTKEYEARLAARQQYVLLVRLPNGGDTFLMQAPPPGYWYDRAKAEGIAVGEGHQAIVAQVTCPDCGSENLTRNGKGSKGRKRYKCKDCSRNFQA
ncbi:IS1/IS1595 family N-terminal zinc-binding domain-containing protein [Sphaerothrix gracilis]|uniref:IS1/IS1595 family N-terminal zinc-binding domain-containing protein n=1 Tax=Sphaerothrix gracilis TaxID=3151835 RepID=UPI0031FE2753